MNEEIFLSYSLKNQVQADELAARMIESGYSVWIDRRDISVGAQWQTQIVKGIKEAKVVVLCVSPESIVSRHVHSELLLSFDDQKKVLPVFLSRVPIPDDWRYALAGVQTIDLSGGINGGFEKLREALVEVLGPRGATPAPRKRLDSVQVMRRLNVPPRTLPRTEAVREVVRLVRGRGLSAIEITGLAGTGKSVTLFQTLMELLPSAADLFVARFAGPAALEPAFFIDELNTFLRARGRGLAPEILASETPERCLETMLSDLQELPLLLVIDAAEQCPEPWREMLATAVAANAGSTLVLSTRWRLLPAQLSHFFQMPLLSAKEAEELVRDYLQTHEMPEDAASVLASIPVRFRQHPQALLTILAYLQSVPFDLIAFDSSSDAVIRSLDLVGYALEKLRPEERRVLALLSLVGGEELGKAIEALGIVRPPELARAIQTLGSRVLAHRNGGAYLVTELVAEGLREFDPAGVREMAAALLMAWQKALVDMPPTSEKLILATRIGMNVMAQLVPMGEWPLILSVTSPEVLERLNLLGWWKEYSLLVTVGEQAAAKSGDADLQLELRLRLLRKQLQMGQVAQASESLVAAEAILPRIKSTPHQRAELHSHRAFLYLRTQRPEDAVRELEASRELRQPLDDHAGLAIVEKLLGSQHLARKEFPEALRCLEQSLAHLEKAPHEKTWFEVQSGVAAVHMADGRVAEAERVLRLLLERGLAEHYPAGLARALLQLALALESRGALAEAVGFAERARESARTSNLPLVPMANAVAARLASRLGSSDSQS